MLKELMRTAFVQFHEPRKFNQEIGIKM